MPDPAEQAFSKSSTASGTDLKVHALLRLKMCEDAKQVLGRRVAFRSKHPHEAVGGDGCRRFQLPKADGGVDIERKSTRLNSSHLGISYAVFCLKKKKIRN